METAERVRPLHHTDPGMLGDYRLLGRLGSGGMGVVYLAEDRGGGYVAVKLVHASLAGNAEFRARFRSEVQRARQVPAFCTAEVLDADLDHQPPYLVVEYVDGPSLAEVVGQRGPLPATHLHPVAVGVATALAGIHGAGVIHRDLKPENVLLAPGSPKVIDFGIARASDAGSGLTRTDHFVGTVAYMAPERFASNPGTPLTAAADIFAWGCVVGYAGTGRTPFHGDSAPATAARILTQPPHLDGLAPPLREVVGLALAKNPADRPSAAELLDLLAGTSRVPRPARRTAAAPRPPSTPPGDPFPPSSPQPSPGSFPPAAPGSFPQPAERSSLHPASRASVPPAPRRGGGWLAVFAVLLVITGLATVALVLAAGDRVGQALVTDPPAIGGPAAAPAPPTGTGSAAPPTGTGRTAPPTGRPAPPKTAPTADPAGYPGPDARAAEPTGGRPIIQDALRAPGLWRNSRNRQGNAGCGVRGVLRAQRAGPGDFRCAGPDRRIVDDFGVEVTTSLLSPGTCAAIWFHWTARGGGHVARICPDRITVGADMPGDRRAFGTAALKNRISGGRSTRVHLVVRGSGADVYRDGALAGSFRLPRGGPTGGQVLLGISVATRTGLLPSTVAFADVDIRSLAG